MSKQRTTYAGFTFHVQSTGRYFSTRQPILGERLLHRIVWTQAFGPVPDKHEIHHINEDWTDNRIENLECIDAVEHQRAHMLEKYKDPEFKAARLKDLEAGQMAAKAWHSSPEGIEWHKQHAKNAWINRKPKTYTCKCCGLVFDSMRAYGVEFCSLSCRQKVRFQENKTAIGTCVLCDASFNFNKYKKQECCSKGCSNKLGGLRRSGKWPIKDKP